MGGMVVIEDMAVIDGILGHWTLQKGEEQSRNFDQGNCDKKSLFQSEKKKV